MRREPDKYKVVDAVWVTLRGDSTAGIPIVDTNRGDISREYMLRNDIRIHVRPAGDLPKGRGNRATALYLRDQFAADGILRGDHCIHIFPFFAIKIN
jgi:hypothetical protein